MCAAKHKFCRAHFLSLLTVLILLVLLILLILVAVLVLLIVLVLIAVLILLLVLILVEIHERVLLIVDCGTAWLVWPIGRISFRIYPWA